MTPEISLPAGMPVTHHGRVDGVGVGTGADTHLVSWLSLRGLVAMRVRASDGKLLDQTPYRLVAPRDCLGGSSRPGVGFTGGMFLVAWVTAERVCAVRVRPDGSPIDGSALMIARSQSLDAPVVAGDGTNFLVLWADGRNPVSNCCSPSLGNAVYGARVRASDGAVLDQNGFVVADGPGAQKAPALAFAGGHYLAMWNDFGVGLRAARIRPTDRVVLDAPLPVVDDHISSPPALSANGGQVVMVWEQRTHLMGRRMNVADATWVDADPKIVRQAIRTSDVHADPVISHDGTNFAVAWRGSNAGSTDRARLHALRLDGSLNAIGSSLVLDEQPGFAIGATTQAMSAGAGNHFVVWNWGTYGRDALRETTMSVQAATITGPAGGIGEAHALARGAALQDRPSASFDGQHHLVVWQEWTGARARVRAARLRDSDGVILDPTGFDVWPESAGDQIYGMTASNGRNHLVLWMQGSSMRAVRLRATDGARLDSQPISVPANPGLWPHDTPRYDLTTDGEDYLVLVIEGGGTGDPMRLSSLRIRGSDGALLDSAPRPVTAPASRMSWVSAAYVQPYYLTAWLESRKPGEQTVLFRRLQRDGTPVDPAVVVHEDPIGSAQGTQVEALGPNAVVVWDGTFGDELKRLRVSDATVLDAQPVRLLSYFRDYNRMFRAVAFDGEHLLVAGPLSVPSELRLQRLTPEGSLLDPTGLRLATSPEPDAEAALSAYPGRRTLLVTTRFAPAPGVFSDRLHFRWLGEATAPPPDAAAPPVDAAVPNPGAPDAPAAPDVAAPDAAAPVDAGPPIDAPVAPADSAAADGTAPGVDGGLDVAGEPDTRPADARADGGSDVARDATADATTPGDDAGCDCQVGGQPGAAGIPGVLVVMAAVALRARARQRRRP